MIAFWDALRPNISDVNSEKWEKCGETIHCKCHSVSRRSSPSPSHHHWWWWPWRSPLEISDLLCWESKWLLKSNALIVFTICSHTPIYYSRRYFLDSSAVFERFARDTFPFGCLAAFLNAYRLWMSFCKRSQIGTRPRRFSTEALSCKTWRLLTRTASLNAVCMNQQHRSWEDAGTMECDIVLFYFRCYE